MHKLAIVFVLCVAGATAPAQNLTPSQKESDFRFLASLYAICVEYVASLADSHDTFSLPSDFVARFPITVDIYDGKVLIEIITRSLLPEASFPFVVGDELVSIDGTPIEQLLKDFSKYASLKGNPISVRRLAATR